MQKLDLKKFACDLFVEPIESKKIIDFKYRKSFLFYICEKDMAMFFLKMKIF